MANENIGGIDCNYHLEPVAAAVRRDRKGKLYIYCPECGIISPRNAKFQDYILQNMTQGKEPTPEPAPTQEPAPEQAPEPAETEEEEWWM